MKHGQKSNPSTTYERRDRLMRERVHDPYKTRLKLREPTVCPKCGAVWKSGRWTWQDGDPPKDAEDVVCQACHRINDRYPAGELTISGRFVKAHEREIIGLLRNTEEIEIKEHPLHRILDVQTKVDQICVTTTDIHLPRRMAQALHDAYKGELDFHYDEGGYFIRANWKRDD